MRVRMPLGVSSGTHVMHYKAIKEYEVLLEYDSYSSVTPFMPREARSTSCLLALCNAIKIEVAS